MRVEQPTTREKWLDKRRESIGGSEAPAAIGISPWQGRLELAMLKRGTIPAKDLSGNQYIDWGNFLEAPIRAHVKRQHPDWKITNPGRYTIQCNEVMPHMTCTLDGLIEKSPGRDGPGVLQIKTAGHFSRDQWDDSPPDYYLVQTMHEMIVTGCTWGVLAVLIGGNEYREYVLEYNLELAKSIIRLEAEFWNHAQAGSNPPEWIDDTESCTQALRKLHPDDDGETIELPAESALWDEELERAKADKKDAEGREKNFKNKIIAAIGDHSFGTISDVRYSHKWQERAEYTKTVKASRFPVLRRSKPKPKKVKP